MAQLGRISGPLLEQNLIRDGVDLKFSNTTFDSVSLLYLAVSDGRIGVKTDNPVYDLDINSDVKTTNLIVENLATIDNLKIASSGVFSTVVGPLYLTPAGGGTIVHQRMRSDDLDFNDNTISGLTSNQSIELSTSGTGTVEVPTSTNIYGNLGVTGNILMDGNISAGGNIIVGDELYNPATGQGDTVIINTDLTQDIIPGDDDLFDLGRQQLDSSPRRWNNVYITDNFVNTDTVLPQAITVSDQMNINGVDNEIFALQSNDDIVLAPDTGITIIESTQWQDNTVTNLLNTPLTFSSTGIGYLRFMGNNGFVIPAGDNSTRPQNSAGIRPELGDTRWNTEEDYLETFSGKINIVTAVGLVTGLPDQTRTNLSGTTNGNGENARFTVVLASGSISSISITTQGQAYVTGDTIIILGTAFTGGATPTNDITVTVGAQIDDGYELSTGGGEEVTIEIMEDLGNVYSLILA
jgi:hypothetical protein